MAPTRIPAEDMAVYRAAARRAAEADAKRREARRRRALTLAHEAADLLRSEFGATRVVLFGSARKPGYFGATSDLDLVEWGVPEDDYLRAVGRLQALDPSIPVDLVEGERLRGTLSSVVEAEGEDL